MDVAPLLLEIARRRTEPLSQVRLIQADAQHLDLPSESTDAVFSRFGVMTFNDPVAAFANFRRILKPSGALAFCCWRSFKENELDHLPLSAVGVKSPVDEVLSALPTPNTYGVPLRRPGSARSSSNRMMKRCRAAISTP